jgi:hypothetical protein
LDACDLGLPVERAGFVSEPLTYNYREWIHATKVWATTGRGGNAHDHHDCGAHVPPPGLRQHLIPERAGASLESAFIVMYKDLTMRPICGREELELFCNLPYVLNDEIADELDAGRRRPEWMWVALDDDRVLARAAWWGQADGTTPSILDVEERDREVEFDRVAVMTSLLRAATAVVLPAGRGQPDYSRFVRADWRQHEATARGVADRMAALELTGARPCGIPACRLPRRAADSPFGRHATPRSSSR